MRTVKHFLYLALLLSTISCVKKDYTKPAEELSHEEIMTRMLDAGYDVQDILDFLGVYGVTTPDVLPAFNNY